MFESLLAGKAKLVYKKRIYFSLKQRRKGHLENLPYLIEYRFSGQAKSYIKELIYEVSKKFGVTGVVRQRPVPHITLFGPFSTKYEDQMVWKIKSVCKNYDLVSFKLQGFVGYEGKNIIVIGIEPSEELKKLRKDISNTLMPIVDDYPLHDEVDDFFFHTTIAFSDVSDEQFGAIWEYLRKKEEPRFRHHVLRVTVLKNRRILTEYDLMQRRSLYRAEALDKKEWEKTRDIFFRKTGVYAPKSNFLDKLRCYLVRRSKKNNVYLISDLHLDHTNIIEYCDRPFKSKWHMNSTILRNWNNTVKNCDVVYFLGDMAFGRNSHPAHYWIDKLRGKIIFIKGSHDRIRATKYHILEYNGNRFLLIHDPKDVPIGWNDWVIHGHYHNNHLDTYPFINGEKKTINVSVELLDYTPISIDDLLKLDINTIQKIALSHNS